MLRWTIAFCTLLITFFINSSFASANDGRIILMQSLEQMPTIHPQGTLFLFDIDDTLIDSPYMLGSKVWRQYIAQQTQSQPECWHDLLSLYVAYACPAVPVEGNTVAVLNDLQERGYAVCGMTARERQRWYDSDAADIDILTIKQLDSIGISFDKEPLASLFPSFTREDIFRDGIFFADTGLKGPCLKRILAKALKVGEKFSRVVFIDDKLSQVNSVASALESLNLDYTCYWYCATEEKEKLFDPLIANIQLFFLANGFSADPLSDEDAYRVAMQCPNRDADYYLQRITANAALWRKKIQALRATSSNGR